MTTRPEVLRIHPVPHPRRASFALDHPYLEQCWGPVLGPSSVALLRHCMWHWQDATPAVVDAAELAAEIGLGRGTGGSSPLWHTIDRLARFAMVEVTGAEVAVYTEVTPVGARRLERLPAWTRRRHQAHMAGLVARPQPAVPPAEAAAAPRMAARLHQLTLAQPPARTLGR